MGSNCYRDDSNHCVRFVLRLILAPLVLFTAVLLGADQSTANERPNILLIMADDLGFSDLGCYGGEIQTPNLDAIAGQGLRFSQFYNTGRCWPTRGSLLTGYYAQQVRRDSVPGAAPRGHGQRPEWAVLLPKMLAPVGYRSYHIGKWHIDGKPLQNGFDRSSMHPNGSFFDAKRADFYTTSAMADDAIDDLRHHQTHHADVPFFQYLAFTAPHFPLHALPNDIAIYDEVYKAGWDAIRRERWQRMQSIGVLDPESCSRPSAVERELGPPYHFPSAYEILGNGEVNRPIRWNRLTEDQQRFQAKKMAIHAAMVHRMDIAIGRVFGQLKQMGQWNNTLIMFLSDNGASAEIMVRGDGHDPKQEPGSRLTYLCLGPGWSTTSNTPFRRHKTWTHEGGIATPFIASWPDRIKDAGQIRRNPLHVIDVVATILEMTGAKHPDDVPEPPGRSFLDELGRAASAPSRDLWWFHDGHRAFRRGDWKAVAPLGEPWELYNLSTDRTESTDLAIPRAEKLNELTSAWQAQLQQATELAKQGLSEAELKRVANVNPKSGRMWEAQQAGLIPRVQVLPRGESFRVKDRHAFVMRPESPATTPLGKPWIFYAPTLRRYPDANETWMHEQFLDAGISVAGIDVGEGYGSPASQPLFDALYDEMVSRGFSTKPVLLGRSRGGLYVSRFAIERPDRVAGIVGIYPVFDYTSYPGVDRAAAVYGATPDELLDREDELNPVRKAGLIGRAGIPVFLIHGTDDKLVPIETNSAAFAKAYRDGEGGAGGDASKLTLIRAKGQGHNAWQGFFRNQQLVDFVIKAAKNADRSGSREASR